MKTEITYKCGHTATVQLYGNAAARQSKIDWYATIDCPDCQAAAASAAAEADGLPALTGSEKQVRWALSIRAEQLDRLGAWLTANVAPQDAGLADRILAAAKSRTAAKWWIDNRDYGPANLARIIVREDGLQPTPPTDPTPDAPDTTETTETAETATDTTDAAPAEGTAQASETDALRAEIEALKAKLDRAQRDRDAAQAALAAADAKRIVDGKAASARISDLEAELKRWQDGAASRDRWIAQLEAQLAALKSASAPAPEKPAKSAAPSSLVDITAKLEALEGVTVTVKGAQTAAPVIWIDCGADTHADEIKALGGRWSGKKSAWYVRA